MLKQPRLKYSYRAEFLKDKSVMLVSEKHSTIIQGALYFNVLSAIVKNSDISLDQLLIKLEQKHSAAEIIYAVNTLQKEGFLVESITTIPQENLAYWNSMGMDLQRLQQILSKRSVAIKSFGDVSAKNILTSLKENSVQMAENGDIIIVLAEDYQHPELKDFNQKMIEKSQPWLLVNPLNTEIQIGPLFIPEETACWDCLAYRLNNNNKMNALYQSEKQTSEHLTLPASQTDLSSQIAANIATTEIIKCLYFGDNERLKENIICYDAKSLNTSNHRLVKRPQCKTCGENTVNQIHPDPIVLQKRSSNCVSNQGGYREYTAEDTLEKFQHHVSPLTGIVQRLEPYESKIGDPVHVYHSGRNTALKPNNKFWLNYYITRQTVGKGNTRTQAKVSGLCEAIERHSAVSQGDEFYIESSLDELGEKGIHPNLCMNFSDSQYENREKNNQQSSAFYELVPEEFDPAFKTSWSPVYSLTNEEFKYLPSSFCYIQSPTSFNEEENFCYPDTNGTAAGNTLEEAILQGFLELNERDAIALWWYNQLEKPGVDLSSFNDIFFNRILNHYDSIGRKLHVLDLTTDLGIPIFAAISYSLESKQEILFAFGAHVDARIGIERAITEVNQMLPVINPAKSDEQFVKYRTDDKNFLNWLNSATIEKHPYLMPSEKQKLKTAKDYSVLCNPNVYDSLIYCIEAAKRVGLETLVLDMTRPDIGLNVVKVVVPGLRHFWMRTAEGRLYDVPVKMGWLKEAKKESELNPIGIFI